MDQLIIEQPSEEKFVQLVRFFPQHSALPSALTYIYLYKIRDSGR